MAMVLRLLPSSCDQAYERIVSLAHHEPQETYAREILREGRRAFVVDCRRTLPSTVVRCILRARTSAELWDCT